MAQEEHVCKLQSSRVLVVLENVVIIIIVAAEQLPP